MLTKESIQQALDIRNKIEKLQKGDSITFSAEETSFYNSQVILSFELAKLAGITLDAYDVYEEHILKIALFLIDNQRIKDWLTKLNNKAFW